MNKSCVWVVFALVGLWGCGGSDTSGGGTPNSGTTPMQTCSASNCAGCCFNNVCQTGTAASACGKAGATCSVCGSAQVCKADQTCGVDPNGVWLVQPVSAQIASSNNGSSWDADDSPPDVFVNSTCPGATGASVTPEVESYTPSWTSGGCTAKAGQLLASKWTFQLWDSDISSDDTITDVLNFQFTEAQLTAGTITFAPSGGMKSLTVKLQKQP